MQKSQKPPDTGRSSRSFRDDGGALRVLLCCPMATVAFVEVAKALSGADVPEEIMGAIRLGRLTALRKPTGGVRGIVAGDIVRRLVARTMI